MSKHTPGPWHAMGWNVYDKDDMIADAGFVSEVKSDANARLIAAAPDMLEALESIEDMRSMQGADRYRVKAAIAKAKGQ